MGKSGRAGGRRVKYRKNKRPKQEGGREVAEPRDH